MNKEEVAATIKQKKADCIENLRLLYAIFNKTELSVAGKREQEIGEETEQAKELLQTLKDRQDVIGGAGHKRVCPCCGLKLPRGYFSKLCEEVRQQEQKVELLEEEAERIGSERELRPTNALTEEISKKEIELREIEKLEREARETGLI